MVLQKMGFDFERAGACKLAHWSTVEADTLKDMSIQDLTRVKERFGGEFYGMHRIDLQRELLRLVNSKITTKDMLSDGESQAAGITLQLDSKVVHVDTGAGKVQLEDGKVEEADLIIAADGVHSVLRGMVFGGAEVAARASHQSAFRFFVPTEDMMRTEAGRRLVDWNATHAGATMFVDTTVGLYERYIAWYGVSG